MVAMVPYDTLALVREYGNKVSYQWGSGGGGGQIQKHFEQQRRRTPASAIRYSKVWYIVNVRY